MITLTIIITIIVASIVVVKVKGKGCILCPWFVELAQILIVLNSIFAVFVSIVLLVMSTDYSSTVLERQSIVEQYDNGKNAYVAPQVVKFNKGLRQEQYLNNNTILCDFIDERINDIKPIKTK